MEALLTGWSRKTQTLLHMLILIASNSNQKTLKRPPNGSWNKMACTGVSVDHISQPSTDAVGCCSGSYQRLLALYTFVPLTALITFAVLAVLPSLVWPHPSSPSRYPPFFPSPLPEFLLSSSMFALAHQLRVPFYTASSLLLRPDIASLLTTFLHVLLVNFLRLASLALLQVRHNMENLRPTWQDPSFHTVWWLSFNIAEILVSLLQGYQHIALYRDVMVPPGREREFLERLKAPASPSLSNGDPNGWRSSTEQLPEDSREDLRQLEDQSTEDAHRHADTLNWRVQHNFDELLAQRAREELEEVYGIAPIVRLASSCIYARITSDTHDRKFPSLCRVCNVLTPSFSPSVSRFSCRLLISAPRCLSQTWTGGSFHTLASLTNRSPSRFRS